MSTTTPHLSLLKADAGELVNVTTQINAAFDKIDTDALSKSNRLTGVESVAGLIPWTAWTPVVTYGSNKTVVVGTLFAEYFRFNNLVFCNVVLDNCVADSAAPSPLDRSIRLKLPYLHATKKNLQGDATFTDVGSITFFLQDISNVGTEDTISFLPLVYDSASIPFARFKRDTGTVPVLGLIAGTTKFSASFSYRSNGVITP